MKTYVAQNGVFGYYIESSFIECGYDIKVTKVIKNIDTGAISFEVRFIAASEVVVAEIDFNSLKDELNAKGYAISNDNEKHVKAYLQQQIVKKKAVSVYNQLGWCKIDNELAFKGYNLYSEGGGAASYVGTYDIMPSEEIEGFKNDLKRIIIGNTPLETAVVIGLSACVVGYISNFAAVDSLICNIYGQSTTGKTTAAKLAISMGGNVDCGKDKNSLSGNCHATKNALLGKLANNFGYPMLFDELGRLDRNVDITQLIYTIADGTDKSRMNKNSSLKIGDRWATTVIFTGEFSMLEDKSAPKGTEIRVLSFPYVLWTKDAEQASEVERFSKEYAGLGISLLAKEIIADSKGFYNAYEKLAIETRAEIPVEEAYKARIAKSVSILKLTAKYASHVFGVAFNEEGIINFIYSNLKQSAETPAWKTAYDYVVNCICKNLDMFGCEKPAPYLHKKKTLDGRIYETRMAHSSTFGYVEYIVDGNEVYVCDRCVVIESVFDDWIKKGNIENISTILREWRERKLLHTKDNTRLKSKKVVTNSGPYVSCYVINLNGAGVIPTKQHIEVLENNNPKAEKATTEVSDCKQLTYEEF